MKITQFTFLDNGGIRFTKFLQKNDPGGIEGNLDSLIIPVPADLEGYLGPQQKIDALSTLINVVDLPESQNNEDNNVVDDSLNKNQDLPNLPLHVNATKKNPTLSRKRSLQSSQSGLQNVSNNEQGTMIINNYYLNGDNITINQY
ncbi:12813_t:CDS:2 [Racocetra fulgida]|uniref:12813_t:CDS:1 n=1 Tax=Racocetra fulgida TaxID=60492 RepID=A0A9N9BLN6_9GLOM|nr:12813_t:CDS:2 [Racocetra fulgida]